MAKNQNNNVAPATQKTDPGAKKDALATALAQIEKQFGKGAVMKLGDNAAMQVDAISTGSIGLDLALGVGGVPRGRIIEVYGPESSGKTTLALHVLAEAQKKGGDVAFIDVEHALDPVYAEALGVDINNLLVSQPDTGEQAMEICEALVRSGAIDAIVVDSVAAMVPRAEIEGEMGDSHVGLQARLMSQAMRKLTSVIGKTNTVCIFINQLREKVGVVYGNPEVTTGGRALKYYSSVRIDIHLVQFSYKEYALHGKPFVLFQRVDELPPDMRPAAVHGYPGHLFKLVICLIAVALYVPPVSTQDFPGNVMASAAPVIVEHDIPRDRVPDAPLVTLSGLMLFVVDYRYHALVDLDVFA